MERVFFLDLIHGESVYCLEAVRHAGGINLSLALVGKVGTCYLPGKGETQVIDRDGLGNLDNMEQFLSDKLP